MDIKELMKAFNDYEEAEYTTAVIRPVILCKNCNLWFKDDKVGYENLRNICAPCLYFSNLENGYTVCTKPDDFCSYGVEVEE